MAVALGAEVTARIDRLPAISTDRPASLNHFCDVGHQRFHLVPSQPEADGIRLLDIFVDQFVDDENNTVD